MSNQMFHRGYTVRKLSNKIHTLPVVSESTPSPFPCSSKNKIKNSKIGSKTRDCVAYTVSIRMNDYEFTPQVMKYTTTWLKVFHGIPMIFSK